MKKPTQHERIVAVLRECRDGGHNIGSEWLYRDTGGLWLSAGYLKRVMYISECNGRISELRDALSLYGCVRRFAVQRSQTTSTK